MSDESKDSNPPVGHPLAVDPLAQSASPTEPAFIARPKGAPVYHGLPILSDVVVEGFTFGKISDFDAEPCSEGDAFVVAPDNSRAGLVWEVSDESYFRESCPTDSNRWGVWAVSFPHGMTSHENARRNLDHILPELKKRWQEWRESQLAAMQNIPVQIMRFVDGSFPGWVECELMDAHGKRHVIRDKVPMFTEEILDAKSFYPTTGTMQCEVILRFQDAVGRQLARVSTERFGIESVDGVFEFTVDANLVTMLSD